MTRSIALPGEPFCTLLFHYQHKYSLPGCQSHSCSLLKLWRLLKSESHPRPLLSLKLWKTPAPPTGPWLREGLRVGVGKCSPTGTTSLKESSHLLASLLCSGADEQADVPKSLVGHLLCKFYRGGLVSTLECGSLGIGAFSSGPQ